MAGVWELEVRFANGGHVAAGEVRFAHAPAAPEACARTDTVPCRSNLAGRHDLRFGALLGHELTNEVNGGFSADGEFYLMLGACCDRGEVGGFGRLRDGVISGTWEEGALGQSEHYGTFTLRPTDGG